MKKNTIIFWEGVAIGGLMSLGFYLLLLVWGDISLDDSSFFMATIPFFIALGILVHYAISGQQKLADVKRDASRNSRGDKEKDDLIAMTLHHIRTPLTGMMWSIKELAAETSESNPQKNRIEKLEEETCRMLGIIEKLIQTSRENNGRSSYSFETYSLEKLGCLISDSISKMRPAAYAKDLSVEIETSPLSARSVKIDSDKIIIITQTLFENAIHYTKSGGAIKIRMEENNNSFLFSINDTGMGIPANEQSLIFSEFYRSTNAKHARSEGIGIGLFIAKSFIEAHGGNITFTSSPQGTTFVVRLPISS
ncbi:sensor histidine kinase [bacterium]|nr:MAG: sensor histidine kinase [bacterium]